MNVNIHIEDLRHLDPSKPLISESTKLSENKGSFCFFRICF